MRQGRIRIRNGILIQKSCARDVGQIILAARIALLRREIPGCVDDRQARLAETLLQPVCVDGEGAVLGHFVLLLAFWRSLSVQFAGIGPKRMRKRRFSRPFFSILPMWISPTSPVLFTWVPPQGWLSTEALSPIQTRRILPVPAG